MNLPPPAYLNLNPSEDVFRRAVLAALQILRKHSTLLLLGIFIVLSTSATAQLGHYKVDYSSDIFIVLNNGTPAQMHLENANTLGEHYRGSGLATAGHTNGYPPRSIPAHASMEGNITITLTWVPDFPGSVCPQEIVIMESCSVSSAAKGSPSTSATNGFSNAITNPNGGTANGIDFDQITTSAGIKYSTEPTQDKIALHFTEDQYSPPPLPNVITRQLHVFAYADGTTNAYVDCDYLARVYVANIRTTGTKDSITSIVRKLLVGQTVLTEVKPYLDVPYAPPPSQSNPFSRQSVNSFQKSVRWTFDLTVANDPAVQEPFYRWNGVDDGQTADVLKDPGDTRPANSTAALALISTDPTYVPELHWSYPYSTNNARIYAAATQNIGANLSYPGVDLKFKLSQLITVLRPTPTLTSSQGGIFVKSPDNGTHINDLDDNPNTSQNPPSDFIAEIQARSSPDPFPPDHIPIQANQGPGIKWTGSVKEAAEFQGMVQNSGIIRKGTWCFVQLFRGKRTIIDEFGNLLYWGYNSHVYLDGSGNEDLSRVFILDAAFPYSKLVKPITSIIWNVDPDTSSNPTMQSNEDSPSLTLYDPIADPNTHIRAQRRKATMNDRFELYLMYKPPRDLYSGIDSQWVSLKKLSWHTDAIATLPDIVAQRWHLLDGSAVTRDDIADWVKHPVWQVKFMQPGSLDNYFGSAP